MFLLDVHLLDMTIAAKSHISKDNVQKLNYDTCWRQEGANVTSPALLSILANYPLSQRGSPY